MFWAVCWEINEEVAAAAVFPGSRNFFQKKFNFFDFTP
jgi:hypothetical protein